MRGPRELMARHASGGLGGVKAPVSQRLKFGAFGIGSGSPQSPGGSEPRMQSSVLCLLAARRLRAPEEARKSLASLARQQLRDAAEERGLERLYVVVGIGARGRSAAHLCHQVFRQLQLRGVIQGALCVHRAVLVGRTNIRGY